MQDLPKYSAEIFELLSKGRFISSNASSDHYRRLYSILEDDVNFDLLTEYFEKINFILEKGNGYFYFSREETKASLERKLETAFKWIDILDFFKTYDHSFGSGYRFSIADITVRINTDADLKSKLLALKRITKKANQNEAVIRLVELLIKDDFVELQDEISGLYKVLSSFEYLEEFVTILHIPEEIEDEIPQ